jgi:2'-5' RNA ligase
LKLFLGVKPQNLKENARLRQVFTKIKRTVDGWKEPVRWIRPDLWHVTVLFLGEKTEEEFAELTLKLQSWTPPAGLTLSFQGLGGFPNVEQARVLWAGVRENKAFLALQNSVKEHLGLGISEEESRPHLTLARFRHARHLKDLISLGAKTDFGEESISELILFESVMEANIPKYVPRFIKNLK